MATLMSVIVAEARKTLNGIADGVDDTFWTDAELLGYANRAIKELWKGIIDLYQGHIVTIDPANMSIAANSSSVTGVPTSLFRVNKIRPRVVGVGSANAGLIFKYRTLEHPDFVQAEAVGPVAPQQTVVYYAVLNAGGPVAAPAIRIAPQLSAAVDLEVTYTPVMAAVAAGDNNPIPGESDVAIGAYTVAWALARQREDKAPDPEYISIYATEKTHMLTALTPRSIQEPEFVVGMFEAPGAGAGSYYD